MSSIDPETASGGVAQLASGPDQLVLTIVLPNLDPMAAFACLTEPERICRWWPQEAAITPTQGGPYPPGLARHEPAPARPLYDLRSRPDARLYLALGP